MNHEQSPHQTHDHLMEPTEYVKTVSESDAMHLILTGKHDSLPGFEGRFHEAAQETGLQKNSRYSSLFGHTERREYSYPTAIVVQRPGFISRAIARAKGKEPNAKLHIVEKAQPDLEKTKEQAI